MLTFLLDAFSVSVDQLTVSRCLRDLGWSKKKLRVVAAQQNEELRGDWWRRIVGVPPFRLMFLDESSVCNRTHHTAKGWSPLGIVPSVKRALKKGQRYSILPAYTLEGYVACGIVQGSYDSERFLEFLTAEVLPLCVSNETVIVLDNCSTHRGEVI